MTEANGQTAGAGGGTGDAGGAAGGTGGVGTGGQGAAGAGAPAQSGTPAQGQTGETAEQTIARLTAENGRLEREKQDARVQKEGALKKDAQRSQLYALAKTFEVQDLKPEAEETLESLQQKITGRVVQGDQSEADRAEARTAKVELAVFKMAALADVQVDANRLTNSRSFYEAIKNLDPASAGFEQSLRTAIDAETTKDPTLKVGFGTVGGPRGSQGQAPGQSGAQNHGGSGGGQSQVTQEEFGKMSMLEKNRLFLSDREQFDRLVG